MQTLCWALPVGIAEGFTSGVVQPTFTDIPDGRTELTIEFYANHRQELQDAAAQVANGCIEIVRRARLGHALSLRTRRARHWP